MAREEVAGEGAGGDPDTTRRVQRTGGTSLAVTLPKSWTDAMNVRVGTRLRFVDRGGGRLEISLATTDPGRHPAPEPLRIVATNLPLGLLPRLLIGSYVVGHDHVRIVAQGGLPESLRQEIRGLASRLLGMSVVAESPGEVDVQNFVDPTRYPISRILDQMVRLVREEIRLCRTALSRRDPQPLTDLPGQEEEVDRLYLLMVRQLLIASDDFQVAREIGVASHHYQIGYRVVVKMLEEVGDLLAEIGRELGGSLDSLRELPPGIIEGLDGLFQTLETRLGTTMEAFTHFSVVQANDTLNGLEEDLPGNLALLKGLVRRIREATTAAAVQRIGSNLVQALRLLSIVNEITINRAVEPETVSRSQGEVFLDTSRKR
jgi:phosphate uptake regulator